ncbi:MAG: PilZ domain-containing protein [Acidobacteriota bacterium]|jgi:hypothetical protein|nr:PilZ domain-containing protein [Acidobacteriota bacterium]
MGTAQSRVLQDRRRLSRISVQMECRFKANDQEYGALMLDLSQGGTLISSTLLSPEETLSPQDNFSVKNKNFPEQENKISITLEAGGLKVPMTLKGTIRRSSIGMSEYGRVAQFGVEFEHTPLELLRLISVLSSRRKTSRFPTQIECRFSSDGKEYTAQILDLSDKGAFLSSAFIPVKDSKVSITIRVGEESLTLEGTVTRTSVKGESGSFGVEFINVPPTLTLSRIVNSMSSDSREENKESAD